MSWLSFTGFDQVFFNFFKATEGRVRNTVAIMKRIICGADLHLLTALMKEVTCSRNCRGRSNNVVFYPPEMSRHGPKMEIERLIQHIKTGKVHWKSSRHTEGLRSTSRIIKGRIPKRPNIVGWLKGQILKNRIREDRITLWPKTQLAKYQKAESKP